MKRHNTSCGLVLFLCTLATLHVVGCSSSHSTGRTDITRETHREILDDCREVELAVVWVRDYENDRLVDEYEELRIEVNPRENLSLERSLKQVDPKSGDSLVTFDFENLEARADKSRSRVWFVDSGTGRIVATLDRETGQTTGPDDPHPTWATPAGGVRLGEDSD